MIEVRQTTNLKLIENLNKKIFPYDPLDIHPQGTYWAARLNNKYVGFCGLHPLTYEPDTVFLSRAGLMSVARGQGAHRKMISLRLRHAKKWGFNKAITYTLDTNTASANNLIRCGFLIYEPHYRWADSVSKHEVIYFEKNLSL